MTAVPLRTPRNPAAAARARDARFIVLIVAIVLVVSIAIPTGLFLISRMLSGPVPTTCLACSIGIIVAKTSDGLFWNLTFTSVPSSLTQNGTTLTLVSAGGATLLPATTMYALEGAGVGGVRYTPAVVNPALTSCAAGDHILIPAGTASGQYPPGTQFHISSGGREYAAGTLQ